MPKRALACLCLPLLLLGCGPGRNEFAPPCPAPVLLPAVSDLTRYSPTATTHDLTQLVVQARIESLNGSCKAGDDASTIDTTVRIGLSIQRGPAMSGREVNLPVFLAVALGNDVRTKQIFPVHATFPPNVDRLNITSDDIEMKIPVSDKITGASYGLIAGFQLTPAELAENRAARQGK